MFAHVIEHLLHSPVLVHRDKIRRHQTAHAVFGITEQRRRDASLFRRKQSNQLSRRCARQFLEQRRAIVRRHLVQNRHDLLVSHGAQQLLLAPRSRDIQKHPPPGVRQDPKDDHLFVFRQIENHFGHISRRPFTKHFTQRREIARLDHAPDFRF